ncbi:MULTISPECIES: thiamine pyrophosphate-binding protein [unclassified Mesorhizobium]|uniref:thiamine pyrophosphate-binding protein n=1 Tax=unclassified Mesorhizobium TaxID=325217 RepID=UPI001093A136|nr:MULTISPECIES: thiamine pyrophosphate-binding protein [unclassified Mesorhizobium]TGQ77297.1 thiamine pyrophosphate-binding protein [Mesorhizobium sp. M8A.F.Ca.ET.207.01.1.1]TGS39051.1 thiamine pyrophosphate-binding protein [Mesorhizobium sp. M8A.F.Ca.ET.182.01.1.1]TGS77332.1 thiamine pyrophosphate-binding protein [Mesorhizobium sp. M8A.F.Ca.ET.181.01.1.1]TGT36285.1 thiamine pyrophosphate-binding protein [Mesorhizobium sp. M8A.F.Ca.ET.165.01.1.1]
MNIETQVTSAPSAKGAAGAQETAAEAIVDALVKEGVPFVFGMTGDTILPIIDGLHARSSEIRYITTRLEMSAVAMADGYSRVTGKLGVVTMHVGPAVANAVLGTWTAHKDNVPVMVLSANLDRFRLGRDIWHEFDVVGVFSKFTKFSDQMIEAKDARRLMRTAMHVAQSGLPGCVHLDFPKDLLAQPADTETFDLSLRGGAHMGFVARAPRPEEEAVERALDILAEAKSPVIIAGRGVAWSKADSELRSLAEALGIPVVATEMGRGTFPEDHALAGGLLGHFGHTAANTIVAEADAILGLGCQFHNVNTINWQLIQPEAKIIQVESEPLEIGRQYAVAVGVHADTGAFLRDVLDRLRSRSTTRPSEYRDAAIARLSELKRQERETFYSVDLDSKPIKPQLVASLLEELAADDAIFVIGSGHNTHFSNYIKILHPGQYHYSIGSGSMAWAVAAGMGMKLAQPHRQVIVPIGDGDFSMNAQELETAVRENIPITVVIYNDVSFGALRIFQQRQYGDRQLGSSYGDTDFVKLAEAYGARGIRVEDPKDLKAALEQALAADVVTVVDVRIDPWELAHRTPEFKEFHRF